ncbi:histidine phosphatase family protein, partial [Klebsiella pneumoniae]|nr:histidine phosphatase family protein [Klebsiella pneumoniae]
MTELCLVRHGQTDWNFQEIIQGREDIPLNALGHRQAEESAA